MATKTVLVVHDDADLVGVAARGAGGTVARYRARQRALRSPCLGDDGAGGARRARGGRRARRSRRLRVHSAGQDGPGDRPGARHHRVARSQRGLGAQGATGRGGGTPAVDRSGRTPRGQDRHAGVRSATAPRNPRRSRQRPPAAAYPPPTPASPVGAVVAPASVSAPSGPASAAAPVEAPSYGAPQPVPAAASYATIAAPAMPPQPAPRPEVTSESGPPGGNVPHIDDMLRLMLERGGSDLHLAVGSAPGIRQRGELLPVEDMATALSARHDGDDPRAALRGAAPPLRDRARARLRVQHPGRVTLPRQRLPAAQLDGCGLPRHPHQDPDARGSRPAQGVHLPRRAPSRARAGDRSDGLGQVDHPRGHGRPHQRDAAAPHHDDGRPDRVHAPQQEVAT